MLRWKEINADGNWQFCMDGQQQKLKALHSARDRLLCVAQNNGPFAEGAVL